IRSPMRLSRRLPWALGLCSLVVAWAAPAIAQAPNETQAGEEGVFVREPQKRGRPPVLSGVGNEPVPVRHQSGSWFLSVGTGTAFPQYDRGEIANNRTGAIEAVTGNSNFAVNSALSFGYRWFDPERWGHWSFDLDFFGSYMGVGVSGFGVSDHENLGFLGMRGRVGYRVWHDRLEPFIGMIGGGVLANTASGGIDHGAVWGYWFSPTGGVRYYIPNTRWSISLDGFFRFIGGVNGLSGPGVTINETPHAGLGGRWLYEPVGIVAIGYRF
ncbi:MAG: hypothetical protein PHP75_09485, partial [Methylacidiphilaceae bacterium]|nr:hypothetical protein [Candidatus Methylacidiphilaceae bacterium]